MHKIKAQARKEFLSENRVRGTASARAGGYKSNLNADKLAPADKSKRHKSAKANRHASPLFISMGDDTVPTTPPSKESIAEDQLNKDYGDVAKRWSGPKAD